MIEAVHGVIGAYSNFVPAFPGVQNTQLMALVTLAGSFLHFQKGLVRDLFQLGRTTTDILFYYILSVGLVCVHRLYLMDQPDLVQRVKSHDSVENAVDPLNSHSTNFWSQVMSGPIWVISFVTYPVANLISWTVSTMMIAVMISITVKAAYLTAPDNVFIANAYQVTKSVSDGVTKLSKSVFLGFKRTVNHEMHTGDGITPQSNPADTPIYSATTVDNKEYTLKSILNEVKAMQKTVTDDLHQSRAATDQLSSSLSDVQELVLTIQQQSKDNSGYIAQLEDQIKQISGEVLS